MRSNPIRFTGMASGMDTDSIVRDLMRPQQYKIDKEKKAQALLKLKEEAWKDMNTKLYNFHTKFTDKLRNGSTYDKRITTSSNTSAIEINNGTTIPEGTHEIRIEQLATSTSVSGEIVDRNVTSKTTVKDLTGTLADKIQLTMRVNGKVDPETGDPVFTTVEIDKEDNLDAVAKKMNEALNKDGFTARYDETNGMFFVNSTKTGKEQSIKFVSAFEMKTEEKIENGVTTTTYTPTTDPSGFFHNVGLGSNKEEKVGKEAIYHYNDRRMKSESNQIEINGIKATLKAQNIDETITILSVRDPDATYDFVKEFITEYNSLIDEINTKIGTRPGKDIMPLTAEERDSMSDSDIKLWEEKLNSSLFYKDPQLTEFVDSARRILGEAFEGESLASIGIVTGSWQEKGKLYILGDEDSGIYSTQTNRLKAALEENSADVVKLLKGLGSKLYENHNKTMLSNNKLKSAMKFYNDKGMTEESKVFDKRILTLEERMYKMEEMQYRKFAAMEKMLSSLNNQGSWLAQQFGGM